jgi:hypothetical protein
VTSTGDDTIRFRTAQRTTRVPQEKTTELHGRLLERENGKGAAEAISNRIPAGVVWTNAQKVAALETLEEWMLDKGKDHLGPELMDLRDELLRDLGQLPGYAMREGLPTIRVRTLDDEGNVTGELLLDPDAARTVALNLDTARSRSDEGSRSCFPRGSEPLGLRGSWLRTR